MPGDGRRLRRRAHPHRLPDPVPRGLRQAARLSRQRRLGAEAALGARGDRPRLPHRIRQRPSRPALPLQHRDRASTRRRARPCAASSMRRAPTRSSSPATRPRRSTSSPARFGAWTSARATRSCSRSWSTTPTSCRGTSTASASGAVLKWAPISDDGRVPARRVRAAAHASAPRSSPSRTCRTCSAPSCRSRRSSASRTRAAFRCWSTAARRPCTCRSTCRISTATSTSSPATRPTGRRASACSTPRSSISTPCRPTRAAAR